MNLFLIFLINSILFYVLWSKNYYPYTQVISHGNPDIRVSTGSNNSNYKTYTEYISKEFITKKGKSMGFPYIRETNGTIENLNNVNSQKSDFAIVQEDLLLQGKDKYENIQFVSALYFESIHFIVHSYTDIENKISSIKDFKIEKDSIPYVIGTGLKNSGHLQNFLMIVKSHGLKPIEITENELSSIQKTKKDNEIYFIRLNFEKAKKLFLEDSLDGLCFTMNYKDIRIKKLTSDYTSKNNVDLVFLPLPYDNEILNHISNNNYYKTNIDTSVYYKEFSKHRLIPTISTRALLVCHKNVDSKIVYLMTHVLFEKNISFYKKIFNEYSLVPHMKYDEFSYCKEELPIHKGAYDYYKDVGQIRNKNSFKNMRNPNEYAKNKVKTYWKYDKIGKQEFTLVES